MLGDKLRNIFDKISGKKIITEDTLTEVSKEIQRALIVSDVNIKLVLETSKKIKALKGEKIPKNIDEKEYIVKRIYDILINLFSFEKELPIKPKKILLVGLFGSGKTTTAVKLATYYKKKHFNVGLIGADTYRMAAFEQLKQFGKDFDVFGNTDKDASNVVKEGLKTLKKDIIIIDSAGRSALDSELSNELKSIAQTTKPDLTFLVLSADIGQIALTQAKEFNDIINIDGIILTKIDGSAKGGGALAACAELKIPVYFIGVGEKINDLQKFDATRYLSNIMGYGDLEGLLEKVKDLEINDLDIKDFNFKTFKKQLNITNKIGGLGKIANMLGLGKMLNNEATQKAQTQFKKFNYIIDSMTEFERLNPEIINTSRIKRIAKGSGTTIDDVRMLIKQFKTMKSTFNQFNGTNPENLNEKDLQGIMEKQMQKQAMRKMKKKKFKFR